MMRLVSIAILILLASVSAKAQTHCAVEPTEAGRAACIGLKADLALVALETRLARVSAQSQGASARAIAALERGLAADQTRWNKATEAACAAEPSAIERQTCRLDAITARTARIEALLETAFATIGGQPGVLDLPDEVETRIPLDGGRDDAFPFIDLDIPLTR